MSGICQQARILILEILYVFLWLKSSPSLILNKIAYFWTDTIEQIQSAFHRCTGVSLWKFGDALWGCLEDPIFLIREFISIVKDAGTVVWEVGERGMDSFSIRDDTDGRCFFYRDGCVIYSVRPLQCEAFPFWFDSLRSEKQWRKITGNCPGIGCGRLHSKKEILAIVGLTINGKPFNNF